MCPLIYSRVTLHCERTIYDFVSIATNTIISQYHLYVACYAIIGVAHMRTCSNKKSSTWYEMIGSWINWFITLATATRAKN